MQGRGEKERKVDIKKSWDIVVNKTYKPCLDLIPEILTVWVGHRNVNSDKTFNWLLINS